MGLSYTTTVERGLRNAAPIASVRFARRHVLLPLTSLVAMLAIGLAYAGRTQSIAAGDTRSTVNLNAISEPSALEAALAQDPRGSPPLPSFPEVYETADLKIRLEKIADGLANP